MRVEDRQQTADPGCALHGAVWATPSPTTGQETSFSVRGPSEEFETPVSLSGSEVSREGVRHSGTPGPEQAEEPGRTQAVKAGARRTDSRSSRQGSLLLTQPSAL